MRGLTRLDRAIAWIAPRAAARRLAARRQLAILAAYDGASQTHRLSGRRPTGGSANAELLGALAKLRNVSRELVRNNPYAGRAVSSIVANTVGAGILPAVTTPNRRLKARVQQLVLDHLDTPAIDWDGRNSLYGLQALACRTMVESGEALIVRYNPPSRLSLPLPLQVRVMEPDYLDTAIDGPLSGGGHAFQGIEFDDAGRRVAYHLHPVHPGHARSLSLASRRIPAAEVIHLYRPDRPGQARGIPWAAPVILTMRDLLDYEDAELMRQKIAACYAMFWRESPDVDLAPGTGQVTADQTPVDMLSPGMIQKLPIGAQVDFASPPGVAGYGDYVRTQVRKIALGFDVPYEELAADLERVNFSSGRMGWLGFQRRIDMWRWHLVIPHACAGIGGWFIEAAQRAFATTTPVALAWTPPKREMIDPTKEIPAARDAVRSGLSSLQEEQRKLGYDPEEVIREQAEDARRADDAGLKFDSDGRFPATAAKTEPAKDEGAEKPDEAKDATRAVSDLARDALAAMVRAAEAAPREAPHIRVEPARVDIAPASVHVAPAPVHLTVEIAGGRARKVTSVQTDADGNLVGATIEDADGGCLC